MQQGCLHEHVMHAVNRTRLLSVSFACDTTVERGHQHVMCVSQNDCGQSCQYGLTWTQGC